MSDYKGKRESSFVKQAAILAIAGLLVRFIGFLYRFPLTYMIREEGNGIYGMGYNIYNFFLIVSSAGLPAAISKLVSEKVALKEHDSAHRIFKVAMVLSAGVGLFCSLLLFFGAGFFSNLIKAPRAYYTLLTLAPTIFIVAIMAVFRGYFQGLNNTVPTAISQVIEQIFNAGSSLALAYLFMKIATEDPLAMGAAGGTAGTGIGALAGLISILLIYRMAKQGINKKVNRSKHKLKKTYETSGQIALNIVKIAVPIIAGTAIFSISGLIDTFMVKDRLTAFGHFTSTEADALFGQLNAKYVTITTLPVSLSTSLAVAAIPSISGSHAINDFKNVRRKINSAVRIAMLLSVPAAVGLGVLAQPIIDLLYPGQPGGKILLQVGSISILFLSLAQITTGMLQGIGKVHIPVIGALVGSLIKIPLNYFLLAQKDINVLGAVISTTVCYIFASGIDYYFLLKYSKAKPMLKNVIVKPLIASAAMGLAVIVAYNFFNLLTGSNAVSVLISIVIGVIVYFTYLILIDGLRKQDVISFPMGDKMVKVLERVGAF